ncbi:SemiSWEET transporter [Agaribacterium haliotis]|uniref:SemiSWEET transporter n=1 Tax=Agaribacterium haliotis TaxID=2013869 RepID=UPI001EFC3629|nr:SemiSWEET transporter [Agaribacterium haliotis]
MTNLELMNLEMLGFIAAIATTSSFLPQAIQVLKTRDTASLSLAMYSIFTVGVALWLGYGLVIQDVAMIAANMITFVLAASILAVKVYNEVQARREKDELNEDCLAEC